MRSHLNDLIFSNKWYIIMPAPVRSIQDAEVMQQTCKGCAGETTKMAPGVLLTLSQDVFYIVGAYLNSSY